MDWRRRQDCCSKGCNKRAAGTPDVEAASPATVLPLRLPVAGLPQTCPPLVHCRWRTASRRIRTAPVMTGAAASGADDSYSSATQEKDLGVSFSATMKVSEQCGIAASKGNKIIGLIKRMITYKEKQLIEPLNKAIFRTYMEYCFQAWRPYRKKGHRQATQNTTKSN